MSIKQVRLSNQAKEQLIRLKTRTGIQQWNILRFQQFAPTTDLGIDLSREYQIATQQGK